MAYSTQADIERELSALELRQLADLDQDGTADAPVIAQKIEQADALIDSYVGVRYTVPLTTPPNVIANLSTRLAIYYLHLGRKVVPEALRKAYEDDIKWLEGVAAGRVSIAAEETPAGAAGAPGVEYQVDDRHFGRDKQL